MAKKRSNGEGTICQRRDGLWTAAVSLDAGKRKWVYGKTRQEVHYKLTEALKARQDGLPAIGGRQTVEQYLTGWLNTKRATRSYRTWQGYAELVRLHVVPTIGKIALTKLTPQRIQQLYTEKLASGLSTTTVRHLHAMLHTALEQAVKHSLVARNVCDLVDAPRFASHDMHTLTAEEAQRFLKLAQGDRFEALYVLALTTGLREGELLGLRWRYVDVERGALQVRGNVQRIEGKPVVKEPKTDSSARQVLLTKFAVDALRQHRLRQLEERLKMGDTWDEQDLVFPNQVGGPMYAQNFLSRSYLPLRKRAGIPQVRFHDLRHSAATLLLASGVHPKVVSEILGHSRIAVTMDLYSHVTMTMQHDAVNVMDNLFGSVQR
jgi:integrase